MFSVQTGTLDVSASNPSDFEAPSLEGGRSRAIRRPTTRPTTSRTRRSAIASSSEPPLLEELFEREAVGTNVAISLTGPVTVRTGFALVPEYAPVPVPLQLVNS